MLNAILDYAEETGSFNPLNIINSTENVILFGLGRYFQEAFERQNVRERFHVKYLCDNDPAKWGKEFCGLPCISPEQVQRMSISESKKPAIIIMLGKMEPIASQMRDLAGADRVFYYNDLAIAERLEADYTFLDFKKDRPKIFETLDLIREEKSRDIFSNILALRLAPHLARKSLGELKATSPQYFDSSAINLTEDETFVDCGAYDGDTCREFLNQTNNKFAKIHAFEFSAANFEKLQNWKDGCTDYQEKIRLYHAGASESRREIEYSEDVAPDSYSIHTQSGGKRQKSQLVRLDDATGQEKVTFIKMDIEGEEMAALKGARVLIRKNQPKAAICVYHRLSDFWNVPLFFNDLMPGCDIKFRQYQDNGFAETVCHISPA